MADTNSTAADEVKAWHENVEALLNVDDPDVIRVREGAGPENLIMSLVLTLSRTRQSRNDAISQQAIKALPEDDNKLANMVEDFHQGSVAFADEPDEFHHLIEFTPPLLREFITTLAKGK